MHGRLRLSTTLPGAIEFGAASCEHGVPHLMHLHAGAGGNGGNGGTVFQMASTNQAGFENAGKPLNYRWLLCVFDISVQRLAHPRSLSRQPYGLMTCLDPGHHPPLLLALFARLQGACIHASK